MKACLQPHKPLQPASQYLSNRRTFSGLTAQLPVIQAGAGGVNSVGGRRRAGRGDKANFLLLAVAQPAIDRAEHVAIIVGPDPLVRVGLGQLPQLG